MYRIPFNKPHSSPLELSYISECLEQNKLSGDGAFSERCHAFFEREFGFQKALLTTSCTDALELSALLLRIGPGDEVILPSFTFVSTANAFALRGAKLVFADSGVREPNITPETIEPLITPRTKAIVVVHYAGVACDMDPILAMAKRHGIAVVEDAAQAFDSYYRGRPLGGLGSLGAFSFHETKNVSCGEGGLIAINDDAFAHRAEILREKGTNRSAFFRGEVDKYGWVDIGSSFLPSDILAAYLFAQLERSADIQKKRRWIWETYYQAMQDVTSYGIQLPYVPDYATNNGHMFYMLCTDIDQRDRVIAGLKRKGAQATFHYISLHSSPYFHTNHDGRPLPECERYSACLVRMPFYYDLSKDDIQFVAETVLDSLRS